MDSLTITAVIAGIAITIISPFPWSRLVTHRLHHVVRTKKMHPEKRRISCVFLVFSPISSLFQKSVFECKKRCNLPILPFWVKQTRVWRKIRYLNRWVVVCYKHAVALFLFQILTTYERSDLPSHSFIRKKTSTANSAFTTSMADAQAVDVAV